MRIKKKNWHSLFVLIVVICAAMLLTEFLSFTYISREALSSFEQSIIKAKVEETLSFSKLINNDFYMFFSEAYGLFSDTVWRNIRVSLESGLLDSHYIEQAQLFWSNLSTMQLSQGFIQSIQVYFLDREKLMTSSSVVELSEDQRQLLERIVQDSRTISLVDDNLYLWVPQYYLENGGVDDMHVVVVANVPSTFLKMYLEQFNAESSESNILFSVLRDEGASFFCALRDSSSVRDIPGQIEMKDEKTGFKICEINGERNVVTWAVIGNMNLCLYQVTPWHAMSGEWDSYRMRNNLLGALFMICGIAFMVLLYIVVSRPVKKLQMAIRTVRKGDLSTRLEKTWVSEYQDVYDQFNRMAEQIQELIEHQYAMQLLTARAELSQLQYQINPHFLYNAYFNLRALLEEEDYERAIPFADMLGKYLSYITHSDQSVRLFEEVQYAKAYGEIQQLRFANRIDFQFGEVPEVALNMLVPKLILQPLIENAYEHGVKQLLQGGIIKVSFDLKSQEVLDIFVEDNGPALTKDKIGSLQAMLDNPTEKDLAESIALVNIQRRLLLFYNNESRLTVNHSELGGLLCCLHIHGGDTDDKNTDC